MSSEVYNKVHCTDRGGEHSTYRYTSVQYTCTVHVHTMHDVSGAAPSERIIRMKGKLTRHDRNGATATPLETIFSRSCEEGRCKQYNSSYELI